MKRLVYPVSVVCVTAFAMLAASGCAARKEMAEKAAEVQKGTRQVEEEAKRRAAEEQARLKAEEEARRRGAEEEARRKAEEEARRKAEEEAARMAALSFRDINFDFDKYNLRDDALAILAEHAKALKGGPAIKILVEGHCDERGTVEYNLALGERRAKSARDYLVNVGIDADRLSTVSYGKERPKDPRHSEEGWAINRRDEFKITSK